MRNYAREQFSKRHYEMVAAIFKEERPGANWSANKHVQHDQLLRAFVALFKRDNGRFDADRFVRAAGDYCQSGQQDQPRLMAAE